MEDRVILLGIESSCDETAASVICNGRILSNSIATQDVHRKYGGVVPELASRAHQINIVPVVDQAIKEAGISRGEINAVAYTQGPGLLGSLLVGSTFAKSFAMAMNIPVIAIHHMHAHILSLFIPDEMSAKLVPEFPLLCLTVSGGHTQLVVVNNYDQMEVIGETRDDAAGEAFDKTGKLLGLPYPAGPEMDALAKKGNALKFIFPVPSIPAMDFSFSGIKTNVLYFLREQEKKNPDFIKENLADLCASIQHTLVKILIEKLELASKQTGIKNIGIAGGVSANSELRKKILETGAALNWTCHFPETRFSTDNAAMIAMAGYFKFREGRFSTQKESASAKLEF